MKNKRDYLAYLFAALYVLVTIATLRHSAAGFASIESGSVIWGYLSALAVDAGMALSATGLRKRWRTSLFLGLVLSASASTFTQLLYAVAHAAVMPVSAGAQWLGEYAQLIANWRVIVLPALLPLLSVVYSFAAKADVDAVDVAAIEKQRDDALAQVESVTREADELRRIAPLLDALPQQLRGLFVARASGNGITPAEVSAAAGISLASAQRAVTQMNKEKGES